MYSLVNWLKEAELNGHIFHMEHVPILVFSLFELRFPHSFAIYDDINIININNVKQKHVFKFKVKESYKSCIGKKL